MLERLLLGSLHLLWLIYPYLCNLFHILYILGGCAKRHCQLLINSGALGSNGSLIGVLIVEQDPFRRHLDVVKGADVEVLA